MEKLVQDPLWKIKIEYISESIVKIRINNQNQFGFVESQIEDYQNILKLGCRPPAFTSYQRRLILRGRLSLFSPFV